MLAEIFSPEQIAILTQIIFIDLVLAGDNAIIIGMVASKFPVEQRKKVIFWGIGGAIILRIILTLLTAYLLQITGLRLIGGILLLYIVYKLYVDIIKGASNEDDIKVNNSSFLKAIWTVLLADFTMSLDNVLGVAGAAGHHYHLLIFGLILSIVLMAVAANLISSWIKKYKWIAWIGLLAILFVALDLIYTDIKMLFL
ncbi:YjbE family putative metal transport protein [Pelagibacteraceae bacterium]|nr:YjbE family putative metal transport protein [Pelagibacteraceae bacterium]